MDSDKIKLGKLLRELDKIRGRHTELVSFYLPAGSDINKASELISQEQALTRNVKNKTLRKNVLSTLEKISQELKLYKKLPENGMVIFCGNVSKKEGKADIKLWTVIPLEKLSIKLYWCGQTFNLKPLKELIKEKNNYGIICLDKSSADVAIVSGKKVNLLKHLDSVVPGKTRAGGQCLTPDTLVHLSDGNIIEIKDLYIPCKIKSIDFKYFSLSDSKILEKIKTRKHKLYEIITTYPRTQIETSEDHTFFVVEDTIKEKIASDLRKGDILLMPEKIKIEGEKQLLNQIHYTSYNVNIKGRKLLKKRREEKNLFQKDLAKKIGVTQTAISTIELGKRAARINLLKKICEVLSLNFNEFIKFCEPNSEVKLPKELGVELAQPIGYFLGDGCFEKERISFFEENEQVINFYKKGLLKLFNAHISLRYRKSKNYFQLRVYGKPILRFVNSNFPEIISARESKIPEKILLSKDKIGRVFLTGFYDAEGYVSDCVGLGINNEKLAKMLQLFLLRFNIFSSLHKYDNRRNIYSKNPRYTVAISDISSIKNFSNKINFTSNKKKEKLNKLIEKKSRVTRTRQILFSGKYIKEIIYSAGLTLQSFPRVTNFFQNERGMSKEVFRKSILSEIKDKALYSKLKKLLDCPLIPTKIKTIKTIKKKVDLVDISVGKGNFIANCLLVHNSSVRFYRVRENLLISFLQKIARTARTLLEKFDLKGIIISGPGPIKEKFYNEGHLPTNLKKKIIGLIDCSDIGEPGVRETLERGRELIKETEFVKEQDLLKDFFVRLSKGRGEVVYGEDDTIEALKEGKVEVVLVSVDFENLDRIEELCEQTNTKLEMISTSSQEGVEFKNIGGIGAILRY